MSNPLAGPLTALIKKAFPYTQVATYQTDLAIAASTAITKYVTDIIAPILAALALLKKSVDDAKAVAEAGVAAAAEANAAVAAVKADVQAAADKAKADVQAAADKVKEDARAKVNTLPTP